MLDEDMVVKIALFLSRRILHFYTPKLVKLSRRDASIFNDISFFFSRSWKVLHVMLDVVESTILTETAQFVFVSQNKHDAWHEI
jgi:hypothetical protein